MTSINAVVFPFDFHIAVQQPFQALWARRLLYDPEPSAASFAPCFKTLLIHCLGVRGFCIGVPSPRHLFSSGSTLLFCPAWETLLVAITCPVYLSGLLKLTSPFNTTSWRYVGGVILSNHKIYSACYVLLFKLCPLGSVYSCDSSKRLIL
jgi:hypothetical protein